MIKQVFIGKINGVEYNDPLTYATQFALVSNEGNPFTASQEIKYIEVDEEGETKINENQQQECARTCNKSGQELEAEERQCFALDYEFDVEDVIKNYNLKSDIDVIAENIEEFKKELDNCVMKMDLDVKRNQYTQEEAEITSKIINEYIEKHESAARQLINENNKMLEELDEIRTEFNVGSQEIINRYKQAMFGERYTYRKKYNMAKLYEELTTNMSNIIKKNIRISLNEMLADFYMKLQCVISKTL